MAYQREGLERRMGERAVVVGGSIAGLLAARVLIQHFGEVVIVERDALEETGGPRRGVPQGQHLHILLHRGISVLGQLLPELINDLREVGAVFVDTAEDHAWFQAGGWRPRFLTGLHALSVSRPRLELLVRRRVLEIPGIVLRDRCEWRGILFDGWRGAAEGVLLRRTGTDTDEELAADLVVDASGRGSRTPAWLEAAGHERPPESSIKIRLGYASRLYRLPPRPRSWRALTVHSQPPEGRRIGALWPIDNGRYICSLGGVLGDYPPDDEAGFLEFARQLPVPDFHEVLREAEPLSPVSTYRFTADVRRHYERMARPADGLIVVGDALCSVNPIYGQGMTLAALAAQALGRALEQHDRHDGTTRLGGLSRRFQRSVAPLIDRAWAITLAEDLRYPEVEGRRPAGHALLARYLDRYRRLAVEDQHLALRYLRVLHLLEPPSRLWRPGLLWRVLQPAPSHPTVEASP